MTWDLSRIHYVLVERVPVLEPDLYRWADWLEVNDRIVRLTQTEHHHVSTVFLGTDHAFGRGTPVLFESMVFENEGGDVGMDRYCTWEEAELGHEIMVREVLARETAPGLSMLERLVRTHGDK